MMLVKTKIIRLLIICIGFVSCQNNESTNGIAKGAIQFEDGDFSVQKKLHGEVLKEISDSLIFSGTLSINDEYLVIDEIKSEKALHVIKLPEEKYIGLFGEKGRGPGEILSVWPILDAPTGKIRVLDNRSNKIVEYRIDSLIQNKGHYKDYNTGKFFMDGATIIDDYIYALNHNSKEKRVYILDSLGDIVEGEGDVPLFENIEKEKMSPDYYWADMDHNNGTIAISYRFLPVIQIYKIKSRKWITLSGPDSQIHTTNYKDFSIYNNIQITDKFIYALYNGKKFEGKEWQHCKQVYVFNKKGDILKKYELDIGIKNFCIYNDNILYGLNDLEGGQALIKFELCEKPA